MLLVLRLPLAIFLSTVVIVLQDIRRPVSAAPRSSVGTLPSPSPPPPLFLLPLLLDESKPAETRKGGTESPRESVFHGFHPHVTTISATIARRIQLFPSIENFLFPSFSFLPCPPCSRSLEMRLPVDFLPNPSRVERSTFFPTTIVCYFPSLPRSISSLLVVVRSRHKRFRPRDYSHSLHPRPER